MNYSAQVALLDYEARMQHLDEGTIHAWLDGALDAEESARVEQHARECKDCAAAIAEARGLVAGASRILAALDDVPAGVTPRGAAGGGGSAMGDRSRSLWGRLHLSPLRAAAAALVFLAAGSVLVARSRPAAMRVDTAREAMSAASLPNAAPNASPNGASRRTSPVVAAGQRNAPDTTEPKSLAAAAPAVAPKRDNAAMRMEVAASAGGAEKRPGLRAPVADSLSVSASTRDVAAVDSSSVRDSASVKETRALDVVKRSAAPAAIVGGVAQQPAPAAAPARGYANLAQSAAPSYVGCYAVNADSAAALPQQLALDSTRALPLGDATAGVSGRAQRATVAKPADVSHAVSAIFGNARQPLSNASWQPLPSGGIRLSIDSPMRTLLLQQTTPTALSGSTMISGGIVTVVLRRVECR